MAPLCGAKTIQGGTMKLPKLTAVIEKDGKWYVWTCPELGVAQNSELPARGVHLKKLRQ
jgi:hypothetical protein